MSVWITIRRSTLLKLHACESGLAMFDAIAEHQPRKDRIRFAWTPLADTYLAQSGHAGWMRERRLIPAANLFGANLSGADLSRADLSRADLSGADLSGADLSRTDLSGANLSGADLSGANLSGANLSGADLSGAYRPNDPPREWEADESGCLRRVKS